MRSSRWLTSLLMLSLLACGCVRSVQPILKDGQVILDDSMLGTWVGQDGKGSIQVQPAGENKAYQVRMTDDKGKIGDFVVRLGRIGDALVAEIQPAELDAPDEYKMHLIPVYSFLAINQTTPRIKATMMSADWFQKYLKAHPNELQIAVLNKDLDKRGDEVVITASVDEIQAFLLRHWNDEGVWSDDPLVFVRPGDPTTRPTKAP